MTGAERIGAERATHAERGWTLDHDLRHEPGALIDAAVSFAWGNPDTLPPGWLDTEGGCEPNLDSGSAARARRLVIAGSLIAAELDCMVARGEIT